jgi:hypothetical protein
MFCPHAKPSGWWDWMTKELQKSASQRVALSPDDLPERFASQSQRPCFPALAVVSSLVTNLG